MADNPILVLSTCADQDTALRIAEELVQEHLAACVNIIHNVSSLYRWEGKIQQDQEHILLIKTTKESYAALEVKIKDVHPYELPEIITLPINSGLEDYLAWIGQEVGK